MADLDRVAVAAMNNVLQSEAVLAAVGSSGRFTDTFWTNDHTFDIPYANGATLGSAEQAEDHYAAIERLTASRPAGVPTYIMDSWAVLDLNPLGYQVWLSDEWFVRDGPLERTDSELAGQIEVLEAGADLVEFEAASVTGFGGAPPDIPGHTYPASLLDDDRFEFFTLRVDGELASGVFLFQDPHCTGVFTLFTLPTYRGQGLGTALLRHAVSRAPDRPIATNPSGMSRGIFAKLGFYPVGSRRIWMRPAD